MFDAFIAFQARQQPERNAIVTSGGSLTFAELDAMVNRFARALAQIVPGPDATVAVEFANPALHWIVLLGLSRIGIASTCASDSAASMLIADRAQAENPVRAFVASQDWIASVSTSKAEPVLPIRPERSRLGRVLLSSGTTGRQKRVGLSWALIDASIRNAVLAYGTSIAGSWMVETPIDTVFGFRIPLAAWATGGAICFREQRSLQDMLVRSPPGFLGMVPIQLQELLEALPHRFSPVPGLRIVVTGGRMRGPLAREARLRLTPDLHILYGASECGAATMAHASLLDRHDGAAGYPLPGVAVEIVDDEGRGVPSGQQGHVRIRSELAVDRYLAPEPDHSAFRDGAFHPGDVGRLLEDGLLIVEGRADDLMNVGGFKVLPGLVEEVARTCPGVLDAAAFGVATASGGDQCWLALVLGAGFDQAALRARIEQALNWLPPIRLMPVDALPRNIMGKVDRAALLAAARGLESTSRPAHATQP